ncbi:blast:Transposon TX1 uncharacterized 149 kDa protein [Mytilus galloprovincialis]|uniref:exodeoxyribonuclease III n=1 Tax=Mytilus galloprovincialis TaxID=29158 RepID=A0A8B6HLB7_MYTGA|nr:blast:Transposon TX1 uncharacterized 149 kDa protein [Mytilus galloprovincialis]
MIKDIHICTLNVKGLRDKEKRTRFYQWIKNQKSLITFIQESHFDENLEKKLYTETSNVIYFSHGTTQSRGVAIIIDNKLECKVINENKDKDGRILMLNIEIENIIYSLINIYAPNIETERNKFFKNLSDFISNYAIGTVILGGDMNDALSNLDRKLTNGKRKNIKPVNSLKSLIKTHNLIDIWRYLNPKKVQFTWKRQNFSQASRIDYFLINKDFVLNTKSSDIRPALIKSTDHQGVSLKLQSVTAESKGPGYWKLNNSILEENEYCKEIETIIAKYKTIMQDTTTDVHLLWDAIKLDIKLFTINYCKSRAYNKNNEIKQMEKKLTLLTEKYQKNENNDILQKINQIENQLETHYEYKAKGAQLRSKQDWVEKGEKNTAYFLGLEKNKQTKKTIIKLKDDQGNIVTDQSEILQIEKKFYEKLYSKENENIAQSWEYINSTEVKNKLSKNESQTCDGYVTIDELTLAVNNLKTQ